MAIKCFDSTLKVNCQQPNADTTEDLRKVANHSL